MPEIPKSTQFIGSSEAPKQKEFVLSPEQKLVADVMQKSGGVLEKKAVSAREIAGEQLTKLRGKELVDAGFMQMKKGVWETIKSQVKWTIGGGLVGALTGGLFGEALINSMHTITQRNKRGPFVAPADYQRFQQSFKEFDRKLDREDALAMRVAGVGIGAGLGAVTGVGVGFETAGLKYNKKIAQKEGLPQTEWYDWVVSNVSGLVIDRVRPNTNIVGNILINALKETFNPITVGGMRNVAIGLWQIGKEKQGAVT